MLSSSVLTNDFEFQAMSDEIISKENPRGHSGEMVDMLETHGYAILFINAEF